MNSQQVHLKKTNPSRRLRRNMDAVVNALKNNRSTSNPTGNNSVNAVISTAAKEHSQQHQNPYSRQQFFHRQQKLAGGGTSHS